MRFVFAVLAFLAVSPALAEEEKGRISVTGTGQIDAVPDMAWITMGVLEEAPTAKEAMDAASQSMTAVIERLASVGIAEKDMQTQGINLSPKYDNRRYENGEAPKIIGYVYSTNLRVRVLDLPKLGDILDAVVSDGANRFNGLQFTVQDKKPLMDAARQAAIQDAMAKAQMMAETAGVSVGRIMSLSENGGNRAPMMMAEMAMARDAGPIAVGEVTMQSTVTMIFEIDD